MPDVVKNIFSLEERLGRLPTIMTLIHSDTPVRRDYSFSWPSNDLASFRSVVSKPSLNQL